jgi:YD repeat-containing protein
VKVGTDSVTFGYDADGVLTQAGALTFQRNAQNGLLTGTTLGSLTTRQGYNAYGERDSLVASFAGSELFRTRYQRDNGGRITSLTETIGGATHTLAFAYDSAGRLARVDRDGQPWEAYETMRRGTAPAP